MNRMRATRAKQHPYKRSSDQDSEKPDAKDDVVDFTTDNVFDTTKDGNFNVAIKRMYIERELIRLGLYAYSD
ncbi:hypothetical protein V7S43_007579 [Phytophthora oleae]|uniref:Uncharacterized protein n=1 Tax=Phytophthora oleae TaxID=2107226 RepID=A0ABD3FKC5_9STRA